MDTFTETGGGIREEVRAKIYSLPLDKLIGQPTIKSWNHLREQCSRIAAQVRTTEWGGKHGHLALVLHDDEYRTVTKEPMASTTKQPRPANVNPAIGNGTQNSQRLQLNSSQNTKLRHYYTQVAVEEYLIERITNDIIDQEYVEDLENEYTGFGEEDIKSVLFHIKSECSPITTFDKAEAMRAFEEPWNMVCSITKFARAIDKRVKYCELVKAPGINNDAKVLLYVSSMYKSGMFSDTEMHKWERAVDKSWAAAQAYFTDLYEKKKSFRQQTTTRQAGYDSANSIAEQSANHHFGPTSAPDTASVPESVLTPTTGMSISEQQGMIDYTSALEEKLAGRETEFAAAMTTTQSNAMDEFKAMREQQQKFMEMMISKMASNGNTTPTTDVVRVGKDGTPFDKDKYPECKHCGKRGLHALKPETCKTYLSRQNGGA